MLEDDDDYAPPVHPWVSTWPEAVTQLDRYPWAELHPALVHPEFRAMVAQSLKQKKKRRELGSNGRLGIRCWGRGLDAEQDPHVRREIKQMAL